MTDWPDYNRSLGSGSVPLPEVRSEVTRSKTFEQLSTEEMCVCVSAM